MKKQQIDIGSMYGIREEYMAKGLISEIPEVDYKNFIAHGQNLMFLTVVWGNPVWENIFKNALAMCEKYGIRVIIHDNVMNGKGEALTEDEVREYTSYYKNSPVWVGNGFDDEPAPQDYPRIQHILETFLKVYPDKDTYVNLLPMYAAPFVFGELDFEKYLEDFAKTVTSADYICTDVYPLLQDNGTKYTYDEYLRSLDIQAQLCRKYNKDFRIYIQSMEFGPNRCPDAADFRFQCWVALSFGCNTILHFCYDITGGAYSQEPEKKRMKLPNWSAGRTVNMEIAAVSDVFMQYKNIGAFTYKTRRSPDYADFDNEYEDFSTIVDIKSNQTVLIGCFDKIEGEGHAFTLVNMAELGDGKIADVEFELDGANKVTAYIKGLPVELKPVDGKYFTSLDCGEGIFVTVE